MKKLFLLLAILPSLSFATPKDCDWVVEKIEGYSVLKDHKPTIKIDRDENRISGNASCNRYFGSYKESNDEITLGPIGSTLMACYPNSINEQENKFLKVLSQVKLTRKSGDEVIFLDKDFNKLLEAKRCSK